MYFESQKEIRKRTGEPVFEKILANNFPKPTKDKSQIQEALQTTSIISIKRIQYT